MVHIYGFIIYAILLILSRQLRDFGMNVGDLLV